jgi:hypothetical protein
MNEKNSQYGIEKEPHLGGYIVGGDYHTYLTEIWDWMISNGIKSVMDIGCGEGYAIKYFYDHGCDVLGIEGSINAWNNSIIKDKTVLHDFTKSTYSPSQRYNAIWCCEFVEHVEEKYIDNFLHTFKYADKIFMTHADIGQDGYHHVNCQNSLYWINLLQSINFKYNHDISLYLRELTDKVHGKRLLYFES